VAQHKVAVSRESHPAINAERSGDRPLPRRSLPSWRIAGGCIQEWGTAQCECWQTQAPRTSEIEVSGKVDIRDDSGDMRFHLPIVFLLPLSCRFPFSPERWMNVKHVRAVTTPMKNWRLNLSPPRCPDPPHLSSSDSLHRALDLALKQVRSAHT